MKSQKQTLLKRILTAGKKQVKKLGTSPDQVENIVDNYRQEKRRR